MYMSADIGKWASGLKRIRDECTAAGVKVEFKRVGLDKGGHWEVSGDVKE